MGSMNSSLTRVQPFFNALLERDAWLGDFLRCTPRGHLLGLDVVADPGEILSAVFEFPAPPSDAFLRWLIQNPDRMTWPKKAGAEIGFGPETKSLRERLFGRHGAEQQRLAQQEALDALDELGAGASARQAWAFEGVTKVDFAVQTERLIVFVEGKRTEKISASTHWFPSRSQLVRNLEVVGELAGGRACGVLLVVEEPVPELDGKTLGASLPHLSPAEREIVHGRYLGQVRWRDLCGWLKVPYDDLPHTVPPGN